MKQVLKSFALGTGILMSAGVFAQEKPPVAIGFHSGIFNSTGEITGLNLQTGILKPEHRPGYSGGVHARVPVSPNFSIVPEVNYSRRSFSVSEGITTDLFNLEIPIGLEAVTNVSYIELPLKMQYNFGGAKISGFVNAGPMLGYATHGSVETRIKSILEIPVHTFDLNMGGKMANRWVASGVVGAGVAVPMGKGSLLIEAQYIRGFSDVFNTPVIDLGIRQHTYRVRVGYSIPLGKKTAVTRV